MTIRPVVRRPVKVALGGKWFALIELDHPAQSSVLG